MSRAAESGVAGPRWAWRDPVAVPMVGIKAPRISRHLAISQGFYKF